MEQQAFSKIENSLEILRMKRKRDAQGHVTRKSPILLSGKGIRPCNMRFFLNESVFFRRENTF